MTFLHTADWQMGMRAGHVAAVAERVRAARLETVARVIAVARERAVEFVLIAGDLFEDNQVPDTLVHQVLRILGDAAPIPVYILPGNHDPLAPNSVYNRRAFQAAPANVLTIREAKTIVLDQIGTVLLPYPIVQKRSSEDPTAKLPEFDGQGMVRIGVTHGSLRIEGKYQPDDFPIALDAAQRRGLDYLALGHWHSFYAHAGRCVYPGSPEATGFDEPGSGTVSLVTIAGTGSLPSVQQIRVGGLQWTTWDETMPDAFEPAIQNLRRRIEALTGADSALLRLRIGGRLAAEAHQALDDFAAWARVRLLLLDLDRSGVVADVGHGRLHELAKAHPLLAGILTDMAALEILADPAAALEATGASNGAGKLDGLQATPVETAELRQALDLCDGDPRVLHEAVSLVARLANEVWQ